MKITDIRLRAVKSENEVKLKAYADVTFDGSFVVHGLKIIDGQKGMFVAMPSRKMPDGEYKDIAHPITPELRKEITDTVIAKYNEVMESEGAIPEAVEE
ncbi:MAG: septation regulator SpoVG [Fusobacterium sp.]|uniref:septation regulator SpoVG n=1 Tax=Fusobacterium sp. SB021 TaxID=2744227 RepID=UPI001D321EE1|nr:septation regulator SpoVG [Fusobacterium sp.]